MLIYYYWIQLKLVQLGLVQLDESFNFSEQYGITVMCRKARYVHLESFSFFASFGTVVIFHLCQENFFSLFLSECDQAHCSEMKLKYKRMGTFYYFLQSILLTHTNYRRILEIPYRKLEIIKMSILGILKINQATLKSVAERLPLSFRVCNV